MKLIPRNYILTFIIITTLFALWGFANDITNPMVSAFQTMMEISAAKASLVQFAFYGGYATMAIPAALFIRRFSYKSGILVGLALYAIGAFLFIPSAIYQEFSFFCISLYILTFGLAFLETTANPYILSLGDKTTSTRRLNLAQAFNPVGSLLGMMVASSVVLANLQCDTPAVREQGFDTLDAATKEAIRTHDLGIIRDPYVILGCVVLLIFFVILFCVKKDSGMPRTDSKKITFGKSLRRLSRNSTYREGVVAQLFYVAAQIMNWTFIIHYAENIGIDKATAQQWNMAAMGLFLTGRFTGTWIMKFVNGRVLLTIFAVCAMATMTGVIFIGGHVGLVCLIVTSLFMSIMFPSIYGISLERVDSDDVPVGAAFLVMAIVGGSLLPPVQGMLIDCGTIMGMASVNFSFVLSLLCFAIVAAFAYRSIAAAKSAPEVSVCA